MKWIGKYAPMYFHPKDMWLKEPEYYIFLPNMEKREWETVAHPPINPIPFHKKHKILKSYCE